MRKWCSGYTLTSVPAKHSLPSLTAPPSNLQRNTATLPEQILSVVFSQPLRFVHYSCQRRRRRRVRVTTTRVCMFAQKQGQLCILPNFPFFVEGFVCWLYTVYKSGSPLIIVLQDANNHHHLYLDVISVLSDRKMYTSILQYFSFSTGCAGEDKANKSLAKSTNSECRRYIQCLYIYIIVTGRS